MLDRVRGVWLLLRHLPNMVKCLWRSHCTKPTGFYSRVSTSDCLKFRELKYEVVTATKVVGEHSPPNICARGMACQQ